VGVMWSYGLKPRVSTQLMHVTDWLPTLYMAAGGNPKDLQAAKFDGVDQWDALVHDKPSRRDKALLFIDEVRNVTAVRSDQWKLVSGLDGWYPTERGGFPPQHAACFGLGWPLRDGRIHRRGGAHH